MPKHRLPLFILVIFTSIGLATYAYLGNFTRMFADDYCSIYFANHLGLLRSIWYWYLNWSGRYTAFAFDWLILKSVLGPYRLHYFVPLSIFLWLVLITSTIYLYLQRNSKIPLLHSFSLAGIFLFVVLILSPDIPQSLFWWNGMRSYTLPLIVITFYFLLFQIGTKYLKINLAISCSLGFILFFISCGMGETFAIAQLFFILFIMSLQIINKPNNLKAELFILSSSLAGAICSIIVIILAPGNAIRQVLLPPSPNFLKLISISLQAYGSFIQGFFLEPAKITGLISAVLVTIWTGDHHKEYFVNTKVKLIPVYILGGIALSFVCFPPGVYGYSVPPPARVMIIPVFFLIGCILYAGFMTGSWLANKYSSVWLNADWLIWMLVLLIGYSTIITSLNLYNSRNTYVDFAKKWDQVDAQILQAKANNLRVVNIPAMNNWAGLEKPTDNPKYWPTQCYSNYYGIQVFGPPFQ